MLAFCLKVGGFSLLGSLKAAKELLTTVDLNAANPSFPVGQMDNAKNAGFASGRCPANILQISLSRDITKIAPTVVCPIAGNVIYVKARPIADHVQKCKAVEVVISAVNSNAFVPIGFGALADDIPDFDNVTGGDEARKFARFRVVMQKFFEASLGKHLVAFIMRLHHRLNARQDGDESSFRPLNLVQHVQLYNRSGVLT